MKKRRGIWLAVGVFMVGGLLWHATQHRPTGPAAGTEIGGEEFLKNDSPYSVLRTPYSTTRPPPDPLPEGEGPTIRFATWNIHGGKGMDGRKDLNRIADLLRGFDFAALQEVHGPGLFGGVDQMEFLGRRRRMAWLFAPAVRQWYCLESGNGLLSNMSMAFWQRIPLPSYEDYSYRNLVLCKINPPGLHDPVRFIQVLVTHLNRRHETDRNAQLQIVLSLFLSLREPAVLLGDLNTTSQDPQIRGLLKNSAVTDPVGKVLGNKTLNRVDWILTRGLRCRDAGIIETEASDHPLVWAELEVVCD